MTRLNLFAVFSCLGQFAVAACTLSVSASLPNGTAGDQYSGSVSASNSCPGTITYGLSGLPGVSVDPATGSVTGVLSQASGTPFSVTASATEITQGPNSEQLSANTNYSVLVAPPTGPTPPPNPPACSIQIATSSILPSATVNQFYFAQLMLQQTGCPSPYTWTADATLPAGLTLSASGAQLTGTPTASGTFSFSITVTTGSGVTASKTFSLTIGAASGGSTPAGASVSALPHFAAQDTWTTGFFVINNAAQSAKFSVAFYDDMGNAAKLPIAGVTSATLAGTLPAQGSAYYEASDPANGLISGWAQITADPSIVIYAVFRNNVHGTYYEASVPAATGSKEFEIPFDFTVFPANGAQFYTGFAIANLNPTTAATITCTASDTAGTLIANAFSAATGPPQLNPLGHWAGYLFPTLNGKRGTIDCISTTTLAAMALRFIGTDAFSSVPVIYK